MNLGFELYDLGVVGAESRGFRWGCSKESKIWVFKHLKSSPKPFEWISSLESRWAFLAS